MALVREIKPIVKEHQQRHEETACCWSLVTDDDGNKYIQLDTYGSNNRKLAGKISQSIQFDRGAARQLKELIASVFPDKP